MFLFLAVCVMGAAAEPAEETAVAWRQGGVFLAGEKTVRFSPASVSYACGDSQVCLEWKTVPGNASTVETRCRNVGLQRKGCDYSVLNATTLMLFSDLPYVVLSESALTFQSRLPPRFDPLTTWNDGGEFVIHETSACDKCPLSDESAAYVAQLDDSSDSFAFPEPMYSVVKGFKSKGTLSFRGHSSMLTSSSSAISVLVGGRP